MHATANMPQHSSYYSAPTLSLPATPHLAHLLPKTFPAKTSQNSTQTRLNPQAHQAPKAS